MHVTYIIIILYVLEAVFSMKGIGSAVHFVTNNITVNKLHGCFVSKF